MKSFKGYQNFLTEDSESVATAFEGYISIAYNGGGIGTRENKKILAGMKKTKGDWNNHKTSAIAIAKEMKENPKFPATGKMTHEGKLSGTLSGKWTGTDTTSKADCSVGDALRISLKAGHGAQFMSSHTEEAVSVFNSAIEYMKDSGDAPDISGIVKKVESALSIQVDSGFVIGDLLNPINDKKQELKLERDALIDQDVTQAIIDRDEKKEKDKADGKKNQKYERKSEIEKRIKNEYETGERESVQYSPNTPGPGYVSVDKFKEVTGKTYGANRSNQETDIKAKALEDLYFEQGKFQDEVTDSINEFFNNNKDFKSFYVFEAMTGVKKFTDKKPRANWLLVFETNGIILDLKQIASNDGTPYRNAQGYIWKKAKKAKFRMNWKNHGMSSTRGTYPSVRAEFEKVKANEHKEHSTMAELISEGFESFVSEERVLIEEAIQEQKLINEGLLSWGKSKVKTLYNKIKSLLSKMITKITESLKSLASRGMDAVLFFLGVELASVKVTGFR
jgi:hypothetical protein